MFIYEILNTNNGKRYIGQTTNIKPEYRWTAHQYELQGNKHINVHLQNAWNKYGKCAFVFNILEVCASEESLNDAEIRWIAQFNTLSRQYGYNIQPGGKNVNHKSGRAYRSIISRPEGYSNVVDALGQEHRITNLREFCRLHNLTQFGLRQVVVTKKYFHYKGWRLATSDTRNVPFDDVDFKERGHRISTRKKTIRYPNVISPDGTIYSIDNLSEFCRQHNLTKGNLCMLLHGKKKLYKNWAVAV